MNSRSPYIFRQKSYHRQTRPRVLASCDQDRSAYVYSCISERMTEKCKVVALLPIFLFQFFFFFFSYPLSGMRVHQCHPRSFVTPSPLTLHHRHGKPIDFNQSTLFLHLFTHYFPDLHSECIYCKKIYVCFD